MTVAVSVLIGAVVGLAVYNYIFGVVLVHHWRGKFARIVLRMDMVAVDLVIHKATHCKKGSL